METGLITIPRAALILRKDQKTIRKWLKDGLLPSLIVDGQPKTEAKVVYEVRDLIDQGKNLRKPYERVALLESRINRMERVIKSLLRLNGAGITTAISHLSDRDISKLYTEANKDRAKKNWGEVTIRKWTSVFMQITETDLTRIELIKKVESPWRVFLELCNLMIDYWRGKYTEDPRYFELAYLLEESRKNLRASILIYIKDRERNLDMALDGFFDIDPNDRVKNFLG
jgi:hypothetical protein